MTGWQAEGGVSARRSDQSIDRWAAIWLEGNVSEDCEGVRSGLLTMARRRGLVERGGTAQSLLQL